ncbi:hypothetical protein ACIBI4_00575 [Streptomyces sp. NPDC050418]|uniref:hypothetical protein n=1 Tax=Streptomyces sp. NPDC050418 TaxID=3365612 RepID=UPI003797B2E6
MNGLRTSFICSVIACAALLAPPVMAAPSTDGNAAPPDAVALGQNRAEPSTAASWTHVPVPAGLRPQAALNAAVATSPDEAWAVGTEGAASSTPGSPLLLRFDGNDWQRHDLLDITWQGELLSIAATSPTAVWAVGKDASDGRHLLRYNGAGWREVKAPSGVQLNKVVTGAGETWLLGTRDGAQSLQRQVGDTWRDVPAPPGTVYGLHILSRDDVWAAGASGSGATVSHWDGRTWTQTVVAGTPRAGLGTILVVSPTEIWAGGTAGFIGGPPGRPIPPLLMRYDGTTWERVTVPTTFGGIMSLTPDASGRLGWVSVANSLRWAPPGSPTTLEPGPDFLAWDGQSFTGHMEPAVPGEGESSTVSLAPVPGTDTVWSVGRAAGPEGTFVPRILRFN